MRVALLWHVVRDSSAQCSAPLGDESESWTGREEYSLLLDSIQQAVEVTPQFPVSFHLDVREPPPEKALFDYVTSGADETRKVRHAQASFVVYVDHNDNGKLDARTNDAASPDEVLSASSSYALLSRDPRTITTPPPSYRIIYSTDAVDGLERGYNLTASGPNGGVLPADSEIQLELRPTPGLQAETCNNECLAVERTEDCPADPADLPPIPSDAQHGYTESLDNGADAWTWQLGPDRFVYEARECFKVSLPDPSQDYYSFISMRMDATGCERRAHAVCRYDARGQAPASWPCQTFTDRGQQQPQRP